MHEWHTNNDTNIMNLINEFIGFKYDTDYLDERSQVSDVRITNKVFPTRENAINFVTNSSYGSNNAYLAAYSTNKLTKGYQEAFDNFITKYNEYKTFKNNLTIAYGRKSIRVTCPTCDSSINLKYGKRFKYCPVCGSGKIISDSNWKMLDTKLRICEKASDNLSKEAKKNNVVFICGIEWHC